ALFYYFDKCLYQDNEWEDYIDVGSEERNRIFATAYKQYLFDQVTRAVRNSAHDYAEYMKPIDW
ncbi:MAG: hypothetical protein ACI4J7_12945, partial [Ruminiclostridium sp.]